MTKKIHKFELNPEYLKKLKKIGREKGIPFKNIGELRKIVREEYKKDDLLKEGALEMAEESLKIAKEWEFTLMDGLDKNERW